MWVGFKQQMKAWAQEVGVEMRLLYEAETHIKSKPLINNKEEEKVFPCLNRMTRMFFGLSLG